MSKNLPRILTAVLAILVIAVIALTYQVASITPQAGSRAPSGGQSQTAEKPATPVSPKDEEKFLDAETVTEAGIRQLPASLDMEPTSVEERIIQNLKAENRQLLNDLRASQQRLKELEVDRELLLAEKEDPAQPEDEERSALAWERKRAGEHIRALLETDKEAAHLSPQERQIIAQITVNGYLEIMRRSRLGMAEELKEIILARLLPEYSDCLADGIPFIAPTPVERERLLSYLDQGEERHLDHGHLREDYRTIVDDCFRTLTNKVNERIASG